MSCQLETWEYQKGEDVTKAGKDTFYEYWSRVLLDWRGNILADIS